MTIEAYTIWGRDLTTEETQLLEQRKANLIEKGVVLHPILFDGTHLIREWDTVELANEWVALANSFSPPPVSVEVVVTEED
jgi:hypothetical protein